MIPPKSMPTIKNPVGKRLTLFLAAVLLFAGCGPPGPRALLQGKKLLDDGNYAQAIDKLRIATRLLSTNAQAFNYLGLACHQAGQVDEAERAYRKALALNHDLTEVHYNLGCLWLAQSNRLEQAKTELIAFTLRRPNVPEGWLKLGMAQWRSRDSAAADRSFSEVLRLSPQNPEALTGQGLVRLQRNQAREAAQLFARALKEQPTYRPALLNLAIVAQEKLNDRTLALQKYREYLALKPLPDNAEAVRAIVRQLEQEMASPPQPAATSVVAQVTAPDTNATRARPAESPRGASLLKPAVTNVTSTRSNTLGSPPKPEPALVAAKPVPATNVSKLHVATGAPPTPALEMVKLEPEPIFRPAQDVSRPPGPAPLPAATQPPPQSTGSTSLTPAGAAQPVPAKRGLLQRLNPINLFTSSDKKAASRPTPTGAVEVATTGAPVATGETVEKSSVPVFARYTYRSPAKPEGGNRAEAERFFEQGVQAYQAQQLPQAVQAYLQATQADPAFFDAQYNLGVAASEAGNVQRALGAYENALALRPDSLDARYNFALLLKQANYVLDAAIELERLVARYPNDSRAHLALGNLYAQQLGQPTKAREHYVKMLETDPRNPQAPAIREWLMGNSR
jgi:tetratricopeptide (TPR) repeat protein